MSLENSPDPIRHHPARGVFISLGQPTIVYLTVCTKNRVPWLACDSTHAALRTAWAEADRWLVGDYVIMPDHIHLFCSPRDLETEIGRWVAFWKRLTTDRCSKDAGGWQRDYWDTRLRRSESYHDKWAYVRENPVRAGLTADSATWPFQGRMNELPW